MNSIELYITFIYYLLFVSITKIWSFLNQENEGKGYELAVHGKKIVSPVSTNKSWGCFIKDGASAIIKTTCTNRTC